MPHCLHSSTFVTDSAGSRTEKQTNQCACFYANQKSVHIYICTYTCMYMQQRSEATLFRNALMAMFILSFHIGTMETEKVASGLLCFHRVFPVQTSLPHGKIPHTDRAKYAELELCWTSSNVSKKKLLTQTSQWLFHSPDSSVGGHTKLERDYLSRYWQKLFCLIFLYYILRCFIFFTYFL